MNNKFPQIHLIYNRYKKASAETKAVVEIRVTYDRKQKYFSTGVWLYPNQWKNGKITNCDNLYEISQILDVIRNLFTSKFAVYTQVSRFKAGRDTECLRPVIILTHLICCQTFPMNRSESFIYRLDCL